MELGWMALTREGPVNHSRGFYPAELTAQETFPVPPALTAQVPVLSLACLDGFVSHL